MITEISISRKSLKEILDSLNQVFGSDSTKALDLNIKVEEESIKIYVTIPNTHQAVHELHQNDDTEITIEQQVEIPLNPEILHEVITNAPTDSDIRLKLTSDRYIVQADSSGFASPTSFSLYRFVESEFKPLTEINGLEDIGMLDRSSLLQNLKMLKTVSEVVTLKTHEDRVEIFVSSEVEGEGQVMAELENTSGITETSFNYPIDIIQRFLENVRTPENVVLYQNRDGILLLEMEDETKFSRLYLSPKSSPRRGPIR